MELPDEMPDLTAVPLFPLPNVVLFPRAILALHIFEDRYKTMTSDALDGDRIIAMSLLKPGWEKDYYSRPAIEPVVCAGQILSWEQLPDGKYNFLLQGRMRARVLHEFDGHPYRVAELELIHETHTLELDLEQTRSRLNGIFGTGKASRLPVSRQFRTLLESTLPTADIADLAAFNLLEDIAFKQALLEEADVQQRMTRLLPVLEEWAHNVSPGLHGLPEDPGAN